MLVGPSGFLAELLLPVAFMALLILIKTITSVYDSPNIAYYCGNAWPWYYSTFPSADPNQMMMQPPYTCTQKPATCSLDNYYRYGASMDVTDDFSLSFYGQYGKGSLSPPSLFSRLLCACLPRPDLLPPFAVLLQAMWILR